MTRNLLYLALFFWAIASAYADVPRTFREAKKLASHLYQDHQITFYCGCRYRKVSGKLRVDLASCGYKPRKNPRRAQRVEWEHVVPAWWLGHQRQCWQHGGRKNCRRTDPVFERMEADLHNLVPSIGEVNGDRSNYRYGLIPGPATQYGACQAEVDFKGRRFEPRPEVRGDIARIYRYMQDTYGLRVSKQQRKLFAAWNRQDPPDAWERERWRRISEIMGTASPAWVTAVAGSGAIVCTMDARQCPGGAVVHRVPPSCEFQPCPSRPAASADRQCGAKRYCKQMRNCEEARWYLRNCGLSRLDRDGDGVPCESLCR